MVNYKSKFLKTIPLQGIKLKLVSIIKVIIYDTVFKKLIIITSYLKPRKIKINLNRLRKMV